MLFLLFGVLLGCVGLSMLVFGEFTDESQGDLIAIALLIAGVIIAGLYAL